MTASIATVALSGLLVFSLPAGGHHSINPELLDHDRMGSGCRLRHRHGVVLEPR